MITTTTTRDAPLPHPRLAALTRLAVWPWHRLAPGAVLALAALLNFWQLDRLGYANTYYAAAVKTEPMRPSRPRAHWPKPLIASPVASQAQTVAGVVLLHSVAAARAPAAASATTGSTPRWCAIWRRVRGPTRGPPPGSAARRSTVGAPSGPVFTNALNTGRITS